MPVKRIGKRTWSFSENIRVLAGATVAGPKEGKGQLKGKLDYVYPDMYAGQETWEKAERKMMEDAVKLAVKKSDLSVDQIDLLLAGDLLNQNISSSFSARTHQFPLIGMFGACSASMLTLATGSAPGGGGFCDYVVAAASSHNATAERQFRYPTEYGSQKPESAQWTVTGAGAGVLGKGTSGPLVRYVTMGKVVDRGLKDPFDMGSAMAPAAVDTMVAHLEDTGLAPQDYDLVVTGDLAKIGYAITSDLLTEKGLHFGERYQDCGLMIYTSDQEVFAGGSGCASSALVMYAHILDQMRKGIWNRVMVTATGALMNPVSYQQGESIPCIAHSVTLETSPHERS